MLEFILLLIEIDLDLMVLLAMESSWDEIEATAGTRRRLWLFGSLFRFRIRFASLCIPDLVVSNIACLRLSALLIALGALAFSLGICPVHSWGYLGDGGHV